MYRWLAGLLFLLAAATAGEAHELLDRLDQCIGHLDPELDVGYERVAARCPELTASLVRSAWAPWLPADWNQPRNQLSAEGLTELRTLLARSLAAGGAARVPDARQVPAVLARISQAENPRQGWWQRFKAWLRELTTDDRESAPLGGWLSALDLSQGAARLLAWLALALVMLIALAILINELRIAGFLKPPRRAARTARSLDKATSAASPDDLARYHPREQPALLLQRIADRLTAQGRLPPARALTARELLQRARLEGAAERRSLAELALVSEQLRFSTREPAAASLDSAIAAGHVVLAWLEDPGYLPAAATAHA